MNGDEFNRLLEAMSPGEFINALVGETGGDFNIPPPPAPLPPAVPAGQHGGSIPLVAAQPMPQQPYHLYGQAGAVSQGHFNHQPAQQIYQQPYPWIAPQMNCVQQSYQAYPQIPGQNMPYMYPAPHAAAASYPAVPQITNNSITTVLGTFHNLVPVGELNGAVVYGSAAGVAPPPPNNHGAKKRKREDQQDDRPYVKRPPNAFMLFLEEQRPIIMAQMEPGTRSAVINTLLGQIWKELSNEQQKKYYDQAYIKRKLHEQQHPDWSVCDNYGRKRKRNNQAASASTSGEVTQPSKKLCVTQTNMGAAYSLTSVVEAPQKQTPVVLNVADMSQLPAVCSRFDITRSPTAALVDSADTDSESETSDVEGLDRLDQLLVELLEPPLPASEPQEEPQTSVMEAPQTEEGVLNMRDMLNTPDIPRSPTAALFNLLNAEDSGFESESSEFDGVDALHQLLIGEFGPLPPDPQADLQVDPQPDQQEDPQADQQEDPQADLQEDPQADLQVDPQPDQQEDPQADLQEDPQADLQVDPQADQQEDPQPDQQEDPQPDPQLEQQTGPPQEQETGPQEEPLSDQQLDPLISEMEAPETQSQEDLNMINTLHVTPLSPTSNLLSLLEGLDSASESESDEITELETELMGMLGHLPM